MKRKLLLLIIFLLSMNTNFVLAHSGNTDSSGCHNDNINGGYHCHEGKYKGKINNNNNNSTPYIRNYPDKKDDDGGYLVFWGIVLIFVVIISINVLSNNKQGKVAKNNNKGDNEGHVDVEEKNQNIEKFATTKTVTIATYNVSLEDVNEQNIVEFFIERGYKIVDKRAKGGCIWVITNNESKELFQKLKSKGYNFQFARNGSKSTKKMPAWYLRSS